MTSSTESMSPAQTVEATRQLTRVLDRIGDALAAVDATSLLNVEGELGAAVAAMGAMTMAGDRAAARGAATEAMAALVRCRRLGASFSSVAHALEQVGRSPDGYDRSGGYVERAVHSSVLVRA